MINLENLAKAAQAAKDDGETMEGWRSLLPSTLIHSLQTGNKLEGTIEEYVAAAASVWPKDENA